MSGAGAMGRRILVAMTVLGALTVGGGVAYAINVTGRPVVGKTQQLVAGDEPDGTQPALDANAISDSSPAPSPSQSSASQQPSVAPSSAAPSPSTSKTAKASPATADADVTCPSGNKQREVEQYLSQLDSFGPVTVDGQLSASDCTAIKAFQSRFGISPADGTAGPLTADVGRRITTSTTEAEQGKCEPGAGMTVCVDLTMQTLWIVSDGKVVFGPTVVRTGMPGHATPTGSYTISNRNVKEWSTPYKVWMPYWQGFNGGIGLHQTVSYLHNAEGGSHGCVNLLPSDAKTIWGISTTGTTVKVFGHRQGT